MKLSNLLLFTGAAAASFFLVKNREKLMNEAVESYELMDRIQDNLQNIQRNLQVVQEQKDNLKTISQDLTYQFKLFEQDSTARLQQIQDIWKAHIN
ncbi:hypothetical protein VYI44_01315 [Streptococcus anginosus]|nr:hypothetical protein [Streptococcus anginosus]MED5787909.1 hypothetical protein [Streptococcus anginosus]MED5904431.1 hypothetical protein [Streptococcus anginosus]